MQKKCLIGFVIYNKNKQFLITRTVKDNVIDYGLVGNEVNGDITCEKLSNILKQNLCLNINPNHANILVEGSDLDGSFIIYDLEINKSANSMLSVINNKTEFLWLTYNQIQKLFNEKRINIDQLFCIETCYEIINNKNTKVGDEVKIISADALFNAKITSKEKRC